MEIWLLLAGAIALYAIFRAKNGYPNLKNDSDRNAEMLKGVRISVSTSTGKTSANIDDDGLATFSISYGYEEEKSKNKTPGKWIRPGESVNVNNLTISGGNFYFGGQLDSLNGFGTEASLIDTSLDVVSKPSIYEDESLGYWPKFISISPEARGAYLSWMASDRCEPATPLGYVFIYFYGIERRVIVDSLNQDVDDDEFKALFEEVLRLKGIFGESRSFSNYSTRLLEIMCILRPKVVSHPPLELSPHRDSQLLKYKLATTVNNEEPIPAELALAWLRVYPEYSLRQPARRCPYEFSQLFKRRYGKAFGNGIVVKGNKTRLKIEYAPASSSLRGAAPLPQYDLPDASILKGPINKLISIADECTNLLEAYSRYLGKPDTSRTDIEAILLLPDELADIGDTLGIGEFRKWADEAILSRNGLVDLQDYWTFTKSPYPSKINKREIELIQNLAEKAGYGVAPDARYHFAKPSLEGKLVLFPTGHGEAFSPSQAFNEMGMALRLGAIVASIDSRVDDAEYDHLMQIINRDEKLSTVEKKSLHAYLVWRINTPANTTGLKARLEKLGASEKAAASRILVGVAMADGKMDPDEIKQLEKLYALLGLDRALVTADIHKVSSIKSNLRVTGSESLSVESASESKSTSSFVLDENILAIHESETKDVQSMLGAIFVEETLDEGVSAAPGGQEDENLGIDGLHYALFESLIRKDKWSHSEVEELCRNSGLMISGAIETINDWAFEKVNMPVLEEDGDIINVDQDVVEELEG